MKIKSLLLSFVLFLASVLLFGGLAEATILSVRQQRFIYNQDLVESDYGAGSELVYNNGSPMYNCAPLPAYNNTFCIPTTSRFEINPNAYGAGAKPRFTAAPTDTPANQWWFREWRAVAGTTFDGCTNLANNPCTPTNFGGDGNGNATITADYHSYHNAVALSAVNTSGTNLCNLGGGPTVSSNKNFHKSNDPANFSSTTLCNDGSYTVAQTDPAKMDAFTFTAASSYSYNGVNYRFKNWETTDNIGSYRCDNTGTRNYCPVPVRSYCSNGTTSGCTVSSDHQPEGTLITLRAVYIPRYDLHVTKLGNGLGSVSSTNISGISNCGALVNPDCDETYDGGTTVTLQASPTAGSEFSGWGGACSGTNSVCTVTMDQAKNVTATFSLIKVLLIVSTTGNGSGHVTGSAGINCNWNGTVQSGACTATIDPGTAVSFTETPSSGSGGYWKSCPNAPAGTACSFTIYTQTTINADFKKDSVPSISLSNVRCNARKIRVDVSDADGGTASVDFSLNSDFSVFGTVNSGQDADISTLSNFNPNTTPYSVQTVYFRTKGTPPGPPHIGGTVSGTYVTNNIKYERSPNKPCSYYNFNISPSGTTNIHSYIPFGKVYPTNAEFASGFGLGWAGPTGPGGVKSCITRGYYVEYQPSRNLATKYFANRTGVSLAPVPDQDPLSCTVSPGSAFTTGKSYPDGIGATHSLTQAADAFDIRSGDKVCVYVNAKYGSGFVDSAGNLAPTDSGPNDSTPVSHSETNVTGCQTVPWAVDVTPNAPPPAATDDEEGRDFTFSNSITTIYNQDIKNADGSLVYPETSGDSGKSNGVRNGLTVVWSYYDKSASTRYDIPRPTPYPAQTDCRGDDPDVYSGSCSDGYGRYDPPFSNNFTYGSRTGTTPAIPDAGDTVCNEMTVRIARGIVDELGNLIRVDEYDRKDPKPPDENCYKKSNHPYFKVFTGGAGAGSCFNTGSTLCEPNQKKILAYAYIQKRPPGSESDCAADTFLARGSSAEYAVQSFEKISGGGIQGFYSNSQRAGCYFTLSRPYFGAGYQTFANDTYNPSTDVGGNYQAARRMPDYFKNTQDPALKGTWPPSDCGPSDRQYDLAAPDAYPFSAGFATGKQYIINNAGLCPNINFDSRNPLGDVMDTGNKRFTVYTNSDVIIHDNIINDTTRSSPIPPKYDSPEKIPYLTIITKGDIYISKKVTTLTGVFIAQPRDNGTGGQIFTCSDVIYDQVLRRTTVKEPVPDEDKYDECGGIGGITGASGQLTVFGALIANKVKMHRTYKSLRDAPINKYSGNWYSLEGPKIPNANCDDYNTYSPACAAEQIIFLREFQIGSPLFGDAQNSSGKDAPLFDSYISRPPTF